MKELEKVENFIGFNQLLQAVNKVILKISELEKVENFIGFNQLDSVLPEDLFDVFRVKENSLPTAISLST